jgi:hypothetical protein
MALTRDQSMNRGDAAVNFSIATADCATHLKVVAISLVASIAVMLVGLTARATVETGATVQIAQPAMLAAQGTATIR